jgi:hypothetical protein
MENWACVTGCPDPNGDPFEFEDVDLMRKNGDKARVLWLERFGEPMPASKPPGRKPDERRQVRVPLLLTESEADALDRERGDVPRSEYIRRRLFEPEAKAG